MKQLGELNANPGFMDHNDGSDHSYRMVIEDRYRRMASLRRTVRLTAVAQITYSLYRFLWRHIPLLTGHAVDRTEMAVLFVAIALFFLYKFAYGNGKVQREKKWAIWLYALGSMALTAKHFVSYWMDHTSSLSSMSLVYDALNLFLTGTLQLDSPTSHSILKVLNVSNKIVEVIGIVAMMVGFMRVRDYLMSVSSSRSTKKVK